MSQQIIDHIQYNRNLLDIYDLMGLSEVHSNYSRERIQTLATIPHALGQCLVLKHGSDPMAFVTWALLEDETSKAWERHETDLSDPLLWNSGGNLWVIDFVSRLDFRANLAFAKYMRAFPFKDHKVARWTRTMGTGSVRKIGEVARAKPV